jgi:hypothetical protein
MDIHPPRGKTGAGWKHKHLEYKQRDCTSKVIFGTPRNTTPIRKKEEEHASSQYQRTKKFQNSLPQII